MMIRCGLLAAVLLCSAREPLSAEQAQVKSCVTWDDMRGDQPLKQPENFTTSSGYVFLNGEYLEPPYRVEFVNEKVVINGRQTDIGPPPLPDLPDDFDLDHVEERLRLQRVLERWPRIPLSVQQLQFNNVLVLFDGRAPVSFDFFCSGRAFLKGMLNPQLRPKVLCEEVRPQVFNRDHLAWYCWLANYQAPETLARRIDHDVSQYEDQLALGMLRARAVHSWSRYGRSLNLSAIVLVVAAIGHLWLSAPLPWRLIQKLQSWSQSRHPLGLSLVFVFVLSALDLAWTILMSQAGLMKEANPVARCFIHDPVQLAVFKSFFTFGPIGIFALFRSSRTAQIGAWWACLICTLLASRWLVFHLLDF